MALNPILFPRSDQGLKFLDLHLMRDAAQARTGRLAVLANEPLTYPEAMQQVLEDVRFHKGTIEHTGGVETLGEAKRLGLMKDRQNVALINVDSHSDLFNYRRFWTGLTIGNWVNKAILDHPEINEIVWVMPSEIAKVAKKHPKRWRYSPILDYGEHRVLYVNRANRKTYFYKPPRDLNKHPEKYESITLRMVTAEELPNFKNRPVYLSVDMDYFSNIGFDTYKSTRVPYRGNKQVEALFEKLHDAGVKPFIANTAISPKYSYCRFGTEKPLHPLLETMVLRIAEEFEKACGKN